MEEKMNGFEERIERIENAVDPWPKAYTVYKGAGGKWGAFQMDLTPIHRSKRELGALFVSGANPPPGGAKGYDWDNKIVMSWNLGDIAQVLDFIVNQTPDREGKKRLSLFHDPHAGSADAHKTSKIFNLAKMDNGWFAGLTYKTGNDINEVKLPMSDGEILQLKALLERAIVRILGW